MEKTEPRKGAQSINRAISLLRIVARHNDKGSPLSKIARESGLHIATAHRMLSAMSRENLLHQDQGSKLYYLGIELFLLGNKAQEFHLRDRFRTPLERIARESGDTVFLLIRSGYDALCLDRVEGQYPIRTIMFDVGSRRPLGIGVGGLALIAFDPPEVFASIMDINAGRFTRYPRVTAREIEQLAYASRKSGYILSKGYFYEGVTSIGVPVFNEQRRVIAAIALSSISQRMDDSRCQLMVRLIKSVTQMEGVNFPAGKRTLR
ncbi:MAG: IclR family transcriptional regulator [Syntrophaceae bacterium]|nr:IclR family transcriptional regulator [Syntrophaceae bacterium]